MGTPYLISDGVKHMADSIFGAATKKATEEGIKAVGTSWRAAAGVISAFVGVGIVGYFCFMRIDFFGIAKKKSKEIIIETEKEHKESMKECRTILKRVNVTWDTKAEVSGWKDINGREKFEEIVNQVGKVMKLTEDQVTLIKQAADTSSGYRKTYEFGLKPNNDEEGGNIKLHTGSYYVSKFGEKYNFDIALAYMELSNIQMLPQNVKTMILNCFSPRTGVENNMDQVENADWKAFIEYESHKQLLNEMKP